MPDVNELLRQAELLVHEIMHTGTGDAGRNFRDYITGITSQVVDKVSGTLVTLPVPQSAADATHVLYALRELEASLRVCSKRVAEAERRLVDYLDSALTATGQCKTGDLTLSIRNKPKAPDLNLRRREHPELYQGLCDLLGIKPEFREMEVIRFFHPGVEQLTEHLIEQGRDIPYVPPGTPHSIPSIQIRKKQ